MVLVPLLPPFITACWIMPRIVLVMMYRVRPAGTKIVKTVNMTGIMVAMVFCCGSTTALIHPEPRAAMAPICWPELLEGS